MLIHTGITLKQGTIKGEVSLYCWTPVWLVRNKLYDNWPLLFLFAKQTSQTGKLYSDTSPFSVLCLKYYISLTCRSLNDNGKKVGKLDARSWTGQFTRMTAPQCRRQSPSRLSKFDHPLGASTIKLTTIADIFVSSTRWKKVLTSCKINLVDVNK